LSARLFSCRKSARNEPWLNFAVGADTAHSLQLVNSAMRLNILDDDFINGLSAGGVGKKCDGRRDGKEKTGKPWRTP